MRVRWNREELLILLVLALGIGSNAAIFTLMNAAFISPLPYRDAERLLTVTGIVFDKRVAGGTNRYDPSISEFLEIRKRSHVFEDMAFIDHLDFSSLGLMNRCACSPHAYPHPFFRWSVSGHPWAEPFRRTRTGRAEITS